ncbi:m7GpppX diphosphatase [Dictyocoela muelleri]|nr:m7GpppX diphosphatase [Dictyocoela muelleri]
MATVSFNVTKTLKSDKKITVYEIENENNKGLLISQDKIEMNEIPKLLENAIILTENDRYTSFKSDDKMFKTIFPSSNDDLKKYLGDKKFKTESYEDFLKWYKKQPIPWIDNIIENKDFKETILFRDKDIVICVDEKWDGISIDDLYIIALFTNKASCIRDANVEMLKNCKEKIIKCLNDSYGLKYCDVMMFLHYPPSFYSLHIHVVSLKREFTEGYTVGRAILLDDAIKNLELDENYYKKDIFCIEKSFY